MPFNVVPAREGLLLTKSDRELREFLEQARSVSVFFALDALFPGLNPIIASVLHARVDAAMTGNDKEKTFEQLGKLDVRRCYGVPYLGLLELHYAEKKQFLGIKRRVELIFVTQSGNDYSCVIEGQANLKLLLETMLLYRWEAEIKASVAKAIEEVVRPAMGPFIEKLKALGDDGAAKLTEQERTALFEECQRTWQGYCKSKGVTPTALFEAGMQRLEPRIPKYREIDASGFDFEVDQLKTQFESEQFAYA
ncbi:MAG: hypothetical protein JOZ97_00605 [Candidatus Eremiobacteraeota bacterium]|nr:hypothetical protein [Candidatus Eremiobacteraeota bacterium]